MRIAEAKHSDINLKKSSNVVRNQYISGDVYDFNAPRYEQDDTYTTVDANGFIMDKQGNKYPVKGSHNTEDAGRIVGGASRTIIKIYYGEEVLRWEHYLGVFSSYNDGNGGILASLEQGIYLEDFCAKFPNGDPKKLIAQIAEGGSKDSLTQREQGVADRKNRYFSIAEGATTFLVKDGKISTVEGRSYKTNHWSYGGAVKEDERYKDLTPEQISVVIKNIDDSLNINGYNLYDFDGAIIKVLPQAYSYNHGVFDSKTGDFRSGYGFEDVVDGTYGDWNKYKKYVNNKGFKSEKSKYDKLVISEIDIKNTPFYDQICAIVKKDRKLGRKEFIDNKIKNRGWRDSIAKAREGAISEYDDETNLLLRGNLPWNMFVEAIEQLPAKVVDRLSGEEKVPTVTPKNASDRDYEKMNAWHNGERRENIKACSPEKLIMYRNICTELGYQEQVDLINTELSSRGINESLNESNDEDMGYKLGKWLGARLMTKWTAMLNVEGAEESPDYDEYDQQFDGNFVECLKKLEEYQNLIDQDGIEAYLALENWQSGEYFQGDYDRIIEDLIDRGYLYENDLEEYDDMDESLLNESKPSYNCCGIRISLPELRNRTEQNCKILRDNDDAIDYGSYGTFTTAGLCNNFWGYLDTNSEFEKLVKKYVGHYGPVLSSNREEAAFIFAVDELYPEIWDAIDSYTVNESLEESFNVSDETIEDAIEYYRENAFGFDGLKDYVETDFSHLPKEARNEIYNKMKKKLDESINEDCNSYQYKGKTIINAGDYWFVKGYEDKFPTSDEAEEFVDDKKKDEGVNINIRESLNKMDAESDNTYDLLNLYESKNLSKSQKKDIARMIYENYGLERIYNYLYEATEEEDELPVEDRVKELTNNFKNTNGSYVFDNSTDANKAKNVLSQRNYEVSVLELLDSNGIDTDMTLDDYNDLKESLNENWDSLIYKVAESAIEFLDKNGQYVELVNYSQTFNEFTIEVTGDWKHNLLRTKWLLEDEFEYDGIKVKLVDRYDVGETDSDWGTEDQTYRLVETSKLTNKVRKMPDEVKARLVPLNDGNGTKVDPNTGRGYIEFVPLGESAGRKFTNGTLSEADEESSDEVKSVEDRVKELTNNFKNTNGSYVFEEVQDANKAVTILKSRGYEASQKRTQDGKYRVTANKKNK